VTALIPLTRMVTLTIDGAEVRVPEGTTLLASCRARECEVLTWGALARPPPVTVCGVGGVGVDLSGPWVPACSRLVEDGMVVHTRSDRVRHSRRMVLELLASSVDLSYASADVQRWIDEYGVDTSRYGADAETVAQPVKVDNDLYVRDYSRCILCYKCVEACGTDAQHTFAIAVAGRGFHAHIATEHDAPLPDSACVYCGNCIGVCPTGALMPRSEYDLRQAGDWRPADQHVTRTICSFCGVGCNLELHVQDNRIVKVTSPLDHPITHGHLCIKGRFGFQHVQNVDAD